MDFKSYITEVEKRLGQMTKAQLSDWIYAKARVVEEGDRRRFLESLSGGAETPADLSAEEILRWCGQVEEGELYLEREFYEEYEEGKWGAEWKTRYQDKSGIIPFLAKAILSCGQFVEARKYRPAYLCLDRICRLQVRVEDMELGAGSGQDRLPLKALAAAGLMAFNYRKISLCLLYACYQETDGLKRIEKLYEYFTWDMAKDMVATDIFAWGPEKLKGTDQFMSEWHPYLAKAPGNRAAELLVDACIYLGGEGQLLKSARENAENHPYLYLAYCVRAYQRTDYASCINAAREGVRLIGKNKEIRADIADIGAKAGRQIKDSGAEGFFYREAFYSGPSSERAILLYRLKDKGALSEALERLDNIQALPFSGGRDLRELREVECPGKDQKTIYRFLLGDYEGVLKACETDHVYLGWSSHMKGTVIPLLMLYLKKDKKQKTRAERNLIEDLRFRIQFFGNADDSYEEAISLWRQSYYMPEEKQQYYIEWLLQEVDGRTASVVGGGHRGSYHKAEELIVVLGAILEERGEINGMRNLVGRYKSLYSRKSAFKSEIEEMMMVCIR